MWYRLATLIFLGLVSPFSAGQPASCSASIEVSDSMRFSVKTLRMPASCQTITLNLLHTGMMPAQSMGHNIVVADREDMRGLVADSFAAGLENHYVAPGDPRPYAVSSVIGGGESTSVTFSTQNMSQDGDYVFFCAAPGHSSMMQGTLTLY